MGYDRTDPRSSLTPAGSARAVGANVAPQYFEFGTMPAADVAETGTRTWWIRSQSTVVAYSEAAAGDALARRAQPDEYVILLHDPATNAQVTAGNECVEVSGRAIVVVPPGQSMLRLSSGGVAVRLFTTRSADLCARCSNNAFYDTPDPNVAPFEPWPDPPDGPRIRAYAIDDVAPDQNRFGRIYRCSTFMVNYFYDAPGPRDPAKLSPHHHDDFEQISLQLGGDWVHHVRTPWTTDLAQWRDDEHRFCASPSATVIPPPSIHTSQAVGDASHHLIDVFCPPRLDFSARPGWVLNAEEYPAPTGLAADR